MKILNLLVTLFVINSIFSQQTAPNILLIIADDLGVDAISGFGVNENLPNTPTLDSFRAKGISYTNFWATPQCTPTRASILTGKYGVKTGVMRPSLVLDPIHTSLFTKIKEQSPTEYNMAVIGKWHLAGSNSNNFSHPKDSGVPYYEGVFSAQVENYYDWSKLNNEGVEEQVTEYTTKHLTDRAISWVSNQSNPWFLWLAHTTPHVPFQAPPIGTYTTNPVDDVSTYKAMIENMDFEIDRLLKSMDEDTLSNTIIIFIGDNGTPGRANTYFPDGHVKSSLYEGGIRVPMIISGKSVDRINAIETGLTHAADLHATILELSGVELSGVDNSLSLKASLTTENSIARKINYSDYENNNTQFWATRTQKYKLIEDETGNEEFYDLENDFLELNNLIDNLSLEQEVIKNMLKNEAQVIRAGWSCNDGIKNGNEVTVDDCNNNCIENDVLSFNNIPCCGTATSPSIYYEYKEDDRRVVYSNNYPSHDFCFVSNRVPAPYYRVYKFDLEPKLSGITTNLTRDNGRPVNFFGIALNGVYMMPAPATPFIYVDKNTGQYNWDWVFEPTTNIGEGEDFVGLDCASAHVNSRTGYHYHGNMYEYVEDLRQGISTTEEIPSEVLQVGWAADGFPIVYKFGPDKNGDLKELKPSFQLKSGTRPGDGVSAPCGPYTGKYTNDFEFVTGKGDLDECNGIEASITLTTAQGEQTFEYYYVVTADFPQISRCLKGNFSSDFISSSPALTDVDNDGDGFVSSFDCDDNDENINPLTTDKPETVFDESCGNTTLGVSEQSLEQLGYYVYINTNGSLSVISSSPGVYEVSVFNTLAKLVLKKKGTGVIEFDKIKSTGVYFVRVLKNNNLVGTKKILVK